LAAPAATTSAGNLSGTELVEAFESRAAFEFVANRSGSKSKGSNFKTGE
jgi:hypothetical protein